MSSQLKENIRLNVQLTENEYVLSSLYLSKKGILIAHAGIFFVLVIAFYLLSFGETEQSSLIIAVVIALVTALLGFYRTIRLYKKNFNKDSLVQKQHIYEIGEAGINVFHGRGTVVMSWNDYIRIKKFRGLYFLYVAEAKGHIIPERCFHVPEEKKIFEHLVFKNITNSSS